jgi:hypothetical protein
MAATNHPHALKSRSAARLILALLVAGASLVPGPVAAAKPGRPNQNLLGSELLGRGLITLNFERRLAHGIGVGGGIGIGGSVYLSYVPGQVHSIYLSAGGGYMPGIFFNDYSRLLQGTIGYQFQSPGGFFIRPMITTFSGDDDEGVRALPGLTIGGSF